MNFVVLAIAIARLDCNARAVGAAIDEKLERIAKALEAKKEN